MADKSTEMVRLLIDKITELKEQDVKNKSKD